jgi:hypothetical protein
VIGRDRKPNLLDPSPTRVTLEIQARNRPTPEKVAAIRRC